MKQGKIYACTKTKLVIIIIKKKKGKKFPVQ